MTDSKIYLNVPYQEKDSAKALGAKWDAANKKWYVTADKDIALFARWHTASTAPETSPATNKPAKRTSSTQSNSLSSNAALGVTTYPADKNFVAYDGDEPPWH